MATLLEKLSIGDVGEKTAPVPLEAIDADWPDGVLESDPEPDPAPKTRRWKAPAQDAKGVTPAMRKRIAAEIEAYIELAALPLVMRDPVCGTVLHEQAKPIGDAVATILGRYPDLAAKFLATGIMGDWVKLFIVLQPIAKAFYGHHVARRPEDEEAGDGGLTDYPAYRPGT